MKKTRIILIVLGFVFFSTATYAEMAKEGSCSYRGAKSGKYVTVIVFEEGHIQGIFDEAGVIVEAPEDSPFYHASFHSIGTFTVKQGAAEGSGGLKFTRPNGDTFYGTFNFGGVHTRGPSSGVIKILGGTGECAGMQGEVELLPRPKVTNTNETGYQQMAVANFTWKIP